MTAKIIPFESAAMHDLRLKILKRDLALVALIGFIEHALKAVHYYGAGEFEDENGMPLSVHAAKICELPIIRDVSKR